MSMKLTYEKKESGFYRYGSLASQQELIEKLGRLEHGTDLIVADICDECCTRIVGMTPEEAESLCDRCPATRLAEMIGL